MFRFCFPPGLQSILKKNVPDWIPGFPQLTIVTIVLDSCCSRYKSEVPHFETCSVRSEKWFHSKLNFRDMTGCTHFCLVSSFLKNKKIMLFRFGNTRVQNRSPTENYPNRIIWASLRISLGNLHGIYPAPVNATLFQ
jgi:hypothetical protein